jgi:hypothetical protein
MAETNSEESEIELHNIVEDLRDNPIIQTNSDRLNFFEESISDGDNRSDLENLENIDNDTPQRLPTSSNNIFSTFPATIEEQVEESQESYLQIMVTTAIDSNNKTWKRLSDDKRLTSQYCTTYESSSPESF